MKPIKCKLVCFTRWGSICLNKVCNTISEAKTTAKELIDDGYAFDYKIKKL